MSGYAITTCGEQVFAKDITPKTKDEQYYCSVCKERIFYVREHPAYIGARRQQILIDAYFRHSIESLCVVKWSETEQHITMKSAWQEAYPDAAKEVKLPSGRRADLVITSKRGQRISVECQHSPITPEVVHGRLADHNQGGLFVDFNFSARRLKNYQLDLHDGVFDAVDASAFRTIEIDELGDASQAWIFFDMRFISAPKIVKAPRPLRDINLVGVVDRGYNVIAPENDYDLLKRCGGRGIDSVRGEHERFLEYYDRARNGNFEDPIAMMNRWADEVRTSERIVIPVHVPKSKYRLHCEREIRKAKEKADQLHRTEGMAQAEQRRSEFEEWRKSIHEKQRLEVEARRTLQELAKKESQEQLRQLALGRKLLAQHRDVRQHQDEWGRKLLPRLIETHGASRAYYELGKIVEANITPKKNPEDMLLVYQAALEEAQLEGNVIGVTICKAYIAFYSRAVQS